MDPDKQRIAIAEAHGIKKQFSFTVNNHGKLETWWRDTWEEANESPFKEAGTDPVEEHRVSHLPDYLSDLNAMYEVEKHIGLHNRENYGLRVKWVNALRTIISRECPKNRVGAPIVSDVDLLNANASQRAEALLKAIA